ncbi:MAG: TatD family hydrolase [Firmicutes bacterium]|nr:TatD family hydrolase [Bacillota bacterium]
MYFDTHAHYDDEAFDEDRYELIEEMHKNGVDNIINIATDMESCKTTMALAQKYDFIYAAVGVHPHEVKDMKEEDINKITEYCKYDKIVAVGEIGLDFHYDFSDRDTQRYWFAKQLEMAEKVDLPVIIHSREATRECYEIIKKSNVRKGVIHAFSSSTEVAKEYVKLGFYIGIGGVLTFKNAKKTVEVVENIPMDKILIETDSPYLSPVPVRGHRNNSQNLQYVVRKISEIKQISVENVCEITRKNALTIFFKK